MYATRKPPVSNALREAYLRVFGLASGVQKDGDCHSSRKTKKAQLSPKLGEQINQERSKKENISIIQNIYYEDHPESGHHRNYAGSGFGVERVWNPQGL